MAKKGYIRHEFVINPTKHPRVAAWIESPANAGTVGSVIVALLEAYIFAADVAGGGAIASINEKLDRIIGRLDKINGAQAMEQPQSTSMRETHKGALDNL